MYLFTYFEMLVKKTTYNPDTIISREKLANPFSNESIKERLICSGALNLENNHSWVDLGNGYFKSKIFDENNRIK